MTPQTRAGGLTNVDVVAYALAELQGSAESVHLERIAVRAHEIAPGSFRWDLDDYADLIDKDKVRVSLTDAEKPEKGSLVQGVGASKGGQSKRTDRWRLTSSGAEWLIENQARIQAALGEPPARLKRRKAQALQNRLRGNPLFDQFERTRSVANDPYAFTDLLECSPDATNEVVAQRLDQLRAQVRMLGDAELLVFLDESARAHADMLEGV